MAADVQARWFHEGRVKPIRLVVLHCTVSKEMGSGAEATAHYFATTDRHASAHKVVDTDSTVTCVDDGDTAFGAAKANADGLHLEQVGMPDQTEAEWLDGFGQGMFPRAAAVVRDWCHAYEIPVVWLTVDQVRDGVTKGITDHATVERAFPSTGHWDPGPHYPHQHLIDLVQTEDDMTPEQQRTLDEIHWMLREVKPQTDRLPAIQSQVDTIAWGVLDPGVGLRVMVADLAGRVLTQPDAAAIAAAIPDDLAAQVADELAERLKQ